jgi:ATP-dependent exoDNAse (exonuclease V) beta subunit
VPARACGAVHRRDGSGPAGDFRIWALPGGDGTLHKREAQAQAAQACAAEIARLMRGARDGHARLGDTPLSPGDIAVLVQTHRQGSLVKRVLATWGIGSVELAQASVFSTGDAEQLERVLAAIDAPGDLRRLRAALAADWFGLDADALWRMEQGDGDASRDAADGADAMSWVERFSRYRLLWRERGFAVMWRTFTRELRIAERLMAGADGERRVTDINHLAELTQARASAQPGIAPTLRWLAAQRLDGGGEEAQLRLESDRNLVQIVTVHKSKGLEYAVVFCPFLNDGGLREPPTSALPDAREYHDDAGDAVLHYGCDDEAAAHAARQVCASRRRSARGSSTWRSRAPSIAAIWSPGRICRRARRARRAAACSTGSWPARAARSTRGSTSRPTRRNSAQHGRRSRVGRSAWRRCRCPRAANAWRPAMTTRKRWRRAARRACCATRGASRVSVR